MRTLRSVLFVCFALLLPAISAQAQVPAGFNYQGRLLDGTNLYNGTASVVLRVHDNSDTNFSSVRMESSNNIAVVDGLYSICVTNVASEVPEGPWAWLNEDPTMMGGNGWWLETVINGEPMQPLEQIVSVPYAMLSGGVTNGAINGQSIANQTIRGSHIENNTIEEHNYYEGSVSSRAIANGGIALVDIGQNGAVTGQVLKWSATGWVPSNDMVSTNAAGGSSTALLSYAESGTFIASPAASGAESIAQGYGARALAPYSVVGGGQNNTIEAKATNAVISGGSLNRASGNYSTIAGGYTNTVGSWYATVGGGQQNTASGNSSMIGGGWWNLASGDGSVVAGGSQNAATGIEGATVCGGTFNGSSGDSSFVGAGHGNAASGDESVAGGGWMNEVSGIRAFLGGGFINDVTGGVAVVCGGGYNAANGHYSFIGGGQDNESGARYSMVAGGQGSTAMGEHSTIAGGHTNTALGGHSSIGGGELNYVGSEAEWATIGGGTFNVISNDAQAAVIIGGYNNRIGSNAAYSVIAGGFANTVSNNAQYALVAGRRAKANHSGAFVLADSQNADLTSAGSNTFNARFQGGYELTGGEISGDGGGLTNVNAKSVQGVVWSKERMYTVTASSSMTPGTMIDLAPQARDANDIPLMGFATPPPAGGSSAIYVTREMCSDWTNSTAAAEYRVEFNYPASGIGSRTVSASIICLEVD